MSKDQQAHCILSLSDLGDWSPSAVIDQTETQFSLHRITSDGTHQWHVLVALDKTTSVNDFYLQPTMHMVRRYSALRELLLDMFELSKHQHACHLLSFSDLSDCMVPRSFWIPSAVIISLAVMDMMLNLQPCLPSCLLTEALTSASTSMKLTGSWLMWMTTLPWLP